MRKKNLADALFPSVRRGLLGVMFRDPSRWWFLSEIASALGTRPSSLQRELESLAATGILETTREGRRTYYRARRESALFHELRAIVQKTLGVPAELERALRPLAPRITLGLIYGSVAQGTDRADSDIDLLIVADDVLLEELYSRLAPAERKLGRKVSPTLYNTAEFEQARHERTAFLEKILSRPRVVLIGSEDAVGSPR